MNRPDMVQPILRPGQVWRSRTLYRFEARPPEAAAGGGEEA